METGTVKAKESNGGYHTPISKRKERAGKVAKQRKVAETSKSPLIAHKKQKSMYLEKKVRKNNGSFLDGYKQQDEDSQKHSQYISPTKKLVSSQTQKTTPIQNKKLIKTRFKENLKKKEDPVNDSKMNSLRNVVKSRNKELSECDTLKSSVNGSFNYKMNSN